MPRAKRTVIEYRNYELPPDFPIIVLTGDEWRISRVRSNRLHFHNCLEVGLCHSHNGMIEFEREPHPFSAGDVTCIARNVPHTTYSGEGGESVWSYLFFQPHDLLQGFFKHQLPESAAFQTMLRNCHMILKPEEYPQLRPLVESIVREMTEKPPNYGLCVRALCVALLLHLLRAYDREDTGPAARDMAIAIAPALDFIHQRYMQDFPLDRLAEACHLSPTHFRRLFHELMGVNPLQFLHQVRILESCTLLRATEYSVADIAGRVGYASLSSFNRHFLSLMGLTPTQWRGSAEETRRATILEFSGWMQAEP